MPSTDLAELILAHTGPCSHLKIQKLVYYVEAYHLAVFDTSIVPEQFQAWVHGPVVRELYDALKDKSRLYDDIDFIDPKQRNALRKKAKEVLLDDQHDLLMDVLNAYGSLSHYRLETLTHSEQPWQEARNGLDPGDRSERPISKETMRTYYKSKLSA